MNLDELRKLLGGDSEAATFITDNFEEISYIGQGATSRVFRAKSTRFHHRVSDFAVRIVLNASLLQEEDFQRMYYFEQQAAQSKFAGCATFMKTYDMVRLKSALVQVMQY